MNIKGLLGNSLTPPIRPNDRVDRMIKSDVAHDRDPSGQQAFDQQHKDSGPMSEEQLKKSLEHLENLPFVKEHQWTIALVVENDRKFVLVKDITGLVIRKIPEADLWTLPVDFNDQKGQLLRKTA